MKLMNIADEGAQYKWQLYDLYDKAFPEQEKSHSRLWNSWLLMERWKCLCWSMRMNLQVWRSI